MKKVLLLILFTIICVTLISCCDTKASIKNLDSYTNADNITDSNSVSTSLDSQIHSVAEMMARFSSPESIKEFVSISDGTADQYQDFVNNKKIKGSIGYVVAKNYATSLKNIGIPVLKDGSQAEEFGNTFYLVRKELDISYRVDGVMFRFIYNFDEESPYIHEGTPALNNVTLGTVTLDLYEINDGFFGLIINDTTSLRIFIEAKEIDKTIFDCFDFQPYV